MLTEACVFEWWTDSVRDFMLIGLSVFECRTDSVCRPIVSETVCWLRLVNLNGGPIVSEIVCWLGL